MKFYCDKCKKKEDAVIIIIRNKRHLLFRCGNKRLMNNKEITAETIYFNAFGVGKYVAKYFYLFLCIFIIIMMLSKNVGG